MLEEVIRELTARNNDEQTTSEGVLVWAKRVEAQWAQAAILSDITELYQLDKIKMASKAQKVARLGRCQTQHPADSCADTLAGYMHPNSAQHMGRCAPDAGRWVTIKRHAEARETTQCMS